MRLYYLKTESLVILTSIKIVKTHASLFVLKQALHMSQNLAIRERDTTGYGSQEKI